MNAPTYRYVVERKFKIIKFTPTEENNGRCINCDANQICGSKFPCHCDMDEQYREIYDNEVIFYKLKSNA